MVLFLSFYYGRYGVINHGEATCSDEPNMQEGCLSIGIFLIFSPSIP